MEKKCSRYEELFVMSDETALLEHIKECEICRAEHERMLQVSNLISEVKPLYRKNNKKLVLRRSVGVMAMAASFLMIFLAFFAIQITTPESFVNETIASISGSDYTYEQMGLPVDEFGLIMVDYDY